MPKGVYLRTEECKKHLRQRWSKIIVDYNKSEAGRERARQQRISYNKSEGGIEKHREGCQKAGRIGGKITGPTTGKHALIAYSKSEAGRERSRQIRIAYNKSEKHREAARRGIVKTRKLIPTNAQKILNAALINLGINTEIEHSFPRIKRIVDIVIEQSKIAIEVDGCSHNGIFCSKEEKERMIN